MGIVRYRWAYSITCAVASLGLVIGFSMVLLDTYPSLSAEPSLLGSQGQPLINRIVDYLSFFTIWSNIVVAIVVNCCRSWRTIGRCSTYDLRKVERAPAKHQP